MCSCCTAGGKTWCRKIRLLQLETDKRKMTRTSADKTKGLWKARGGVWVRGDRQREAARKWGKASCTWENADEEPGFLCRQWAAGHRQRQQRLAGQSGLQVGWYYQHSLAAVGDGGHERRHSLTHPEHNHKVLTLCQP